MLKQLFTAAALVATTATSGMALELKQAGFDFYHGNANGCGYNVFVQEKDNVGDVYAKASILCGPWNGETATYERETRLHLWVRCEATGNDWIARRNNDASSTPWEAVKSGGVTQQVVDAACGRIGSADMRTIN